jgi:deoxyhypusine synthase
MADVGDFSARGDTTVRELVGMMGGCGFQATNVRDAADTIRLMRKEGATVFLAYTANLMASGLRGVLTGMVEGGLVDAVVTTGGSIDHDIIRSYRTYALGGFGEDDVRLHRRGINRIGNILVPNSRYILLEKKMRSVYSGMYANKKTFTPAELADHVGSMLPESSFLAACHRRKVPVFCPGLVDSAVGMHLFFFRQTHRDFVLDQAGDMQRLYDIVFAAKRTGGIILGGGIAKHHTIGANLLRGGLDYAVYVTTAQEYDGSLSGARPSEAKSWGKIQEGGKAVTVHADATIALPLIIASV